MSMYIKPVANGLHTEHPAPGLPLVDDSHIPVTDPHAIEAIGRHVAENMWGREDSCANDGWLAFTTDPNHTDFGWLVRFDPQGGRSVLLYRDDDLSSVHSTLLNSAKQLERAGGYWWDGKRWHRPDQVFDWTREEYVERLVPGAVTVSAATMLEGGGKAEAGRVLKLSELIEQGAPTSPRLTDTWLNDLACWAEEHQQSKVHRPLKDCIVNLSAPELAADQLLDLAAMAERVDLAPSTLRSYISRGQADVPAAQLNVGGRDMWSIPVVDDWKLQRDISKSESLAPRRSAAPQSADVAPGIATVHETFKRSFFAHLWEDSSIRKRWALRWRSNEAVQEVADTLAWRVAGSIDDIVRLNDLHKTVRHALRGALHADIERHRRTAVNDEGEVETTYSIEPHSFAWIDPGVIRMLTWLFQTNPLKGKAALAEAALDIHSTYGSAIPATYVRHSLATAMSLDSRLDEKDINSLLNATFISLPPLGSA